jgi:nucleotide-binding universal stress UspA family protein
MNILLVVDGSSYSVMATEMVGSLHFPLPTKVILMTVVPEYTFLGGITLKKLSRDSSEKTAQEQKAWQLLEKPIEALNAGGIKAAGLLRWGNPAEEILKVADEHGISLIVIGAKGLTDSAEFLLGGVALAVMKHAKTSVLLVRNKVETADKESLKRKVSIKRILLATDGSSYSDETIQFLLELPLPQNCEVIIVTALQSHLAAWIKTPTLDFKTNREILARLQADEESEAHNIIKRSERQFTARGYRTASFVLRGGAAESILAAAREYKPDFIALGNKGLTGIEHLLLGSVAERIARYADCSVFIGRRFYKD